LAPSPISILAQHPSGSSPFHDVHVRAGRGGLEAPHIVTQNIYPTFTYRFGDPTALVSGRSMDGKGHGGSLQKHGVLYFSAFPGGTASAFLSITQSTLETCFFITIGCNRDYSFAFCSRGGHEGALKFGGLGIWTPITSWHRIWRLPGGSSRFPLLDMLDGILRFPQAIGSSGTFKFYRNPG